MQFASKNEAQKHYLTENNLSKCQNVFEEIFIQNLKKQNENPIFLLFLKHHLNKIF